jgi:hypothetical protein
MPTRSAPWPGGWPARTAPRWRPGSWRWTGDHDCH